MRCLRIALICADSPAIQKYPGPVGHSSASTTSASRDEPSAGDSSQVTSEPAGKYDDRSSGTSAQIRVGSDEKSLELDREPVLKWSNPDRGEVHGNVFLWTREGRPLVVGSLFKWFSPHTHMSHEFQSLAEEPLSAAFHGKAVWKTSGAGLRFVDVPKADAPAAGEAPPPPTVMRVRFYTYR